MSSWTAFKSQFDKLKSHTASCQVKTEKNDTDSITITDHTSWINRIGDAGNKPGDWYDYINLVKSQVGTKDAVARHNLLSCLYDRAFKAISSADNKRNETYAKLFLDYAQVKSEYSPDEAEALLTYARSIVRRFSIVHTAAAEFEVRQGNVSKAKKILEKARLIEAEPKELVREALRNLENGKTRLTSTESAVPAESKRHCSVGSSAISKEATDEVMPAKVTPPEESAQSHTTSCVTGDDTLNGNLTTDAASLSHLKSVIQSASKGPLRHCLSTPECRQMTKTSDSVPNWKRPLGTSKIGLPMRVKKMSLPFSKKEDDIDLEEEKNIDSIKPLPSHPQENETFGSHAHTSGYLSMSQSDVTVPMETDGKAAQSCDFKEPMKYRTPLASSTHHNIKDKPGSQVAPASFMDLSIVEKPKLAMSSVECKKRLAPPECAESASDRECDKKRTERKDSDSKCAAQQTDSSVKEPQAPSIQPPSLPTPNIPTQPPVGVAAVTKMSTPCMKNRLGEMASLTPSMSPVDTVTVNGQQYFIWKLVGRGGSAKVYQVFDTQKNTRALKCVDLEDANEVVVNGFKNEVRLLKKLQYCKSVIKMYDFEHNEELNKLFVLMDFGETDMATLFKSRIQSGEGIEPHMIHFYWKEMLTAVHALHKEGVIHSDLKPANFMMVAGNLRLIDFGIANAVQQDKTSIFLNTPMGTLNYMSPEAIMESFEGSDGGSASDRVKPTYKISVRSDIWSLGCILYNMVYGKTPFQHIRNQLGKLQAITNPQHKIDFQDIANKNLLDVLKKCLTRDPKSRPNTDELLAHPYLMEDKEKSPAPLALTKAMKDALLQISNASPRSAQSLTQGLLQQLETGGKIDLSTLPSKTLSQDQPVVLSQAPRPCLASDQPAVGVKEKPVGIKQESGAVKVRAPLQCINVHQK
ncbi:dual specificity protein kinase Ttk-like [Haliotis rufescens]|uniref:dual specificity protein kinase Ttk-like n=1 Tax=Haliotis rufescens TaxID=6454 RepID=UPI00201EDBC7|nr:dual specificity protein kinase Ttk-like [Haliotis rufescens]